MKYAIIADIHGNLEALIETIKSIDTEGVDKIFCLGDIVGYGPDPEPCCAIIKERAETVVKGNHEQAINDFSIQQRFSKMAYDALLRQLEKITQEDKDWLAALPYQVEIDDLFCITHSSFMIPDQFPYISSITQAREEFACLNSKTGFFSHTHRASVFCLTTDSNGQEQIDAFLLPRDAELTLEDAGRYLINPGSIGQPRDGNPAASYLIFESSQMIISFKRVEYDYRKTMKKIRQADLPSYLAERLETGR